MAKRVLSPRVRFERRDLWVGVYWTREERRGDNGYTWKILDVYVCLIPMFPVHWRRVR